MITRPGTSTSNLVTQIQVTVTGIDPSTNVALVADKMGNEIQVDTSRRAKGTGLPAVGEQWVMVKKVGVWTFDVQIDVPPVPVITGDVSFVDPVMIQVLQAGTAAGLWVDQTTVTPGAVVPDPSVVIGSGEPDYTSPPTIPVSEGDDPSVDTPIYTDPTVPPLSNDGPIPVPDPTPVAGPTPPAVAAPKGWFPIYFGTYNTEFSIGLHAFATDMDRLTSTRLQVIGLQEAYSDQRDPIINGLSGWSNFRPKTGTHSDEATILWRTADFTLLDSGSIQMVAPDPSLPRAPARYLNWVKLRHHASGRVFYFQNTHFDTIANASLDRIYTSTATMAAKMQQFGRVAPVVSVGDFNRNWLVDSKQRDPRFPFMKFRSTGTQANWELIKKRPGYGTRGGSLIDIVWFTRAAHYSIRPLEQWILTGYHSDHRPVMVEALIKSVL